MSLIHPFTGELLDPDDLPTLERAEIELETYLSGFRPLYGVRRDLRERIAELRGPALLPGRRHRSAVQERAGECPRCGDRHDEWKHLKDENDRLRSELGSKEDSPSDR